MQLHSVLGRETQPGESCVRKRGLESSNVGLVPTLVPCSNMQLLNARKRERAMLNQKKNGIAAFGLSVGPKCENKISEWLNHE